MSESRLASIFNSQKPKQQPKSSAINQPGRKEIDESLLGHEQQQVFDLMETTSKSMFITGKAGTGKSYLLNFFIQNTSKNVAVLAPTGVAAISVGGQTIHSFFKLPPHTPIPEESMHPSTNRARMYACLDAIVIDESSMINAEIMNAIDQILRYATQTDIPFGGKQMLLFGDLYQLPPIANPQVRRYFDDKYGGIFFFNAPGIKSCGLEVREMKRVFRQKDPVFIDILNGVRDGSITDDKLDLLNERAHVSAEEDMAVIISPTKDAVSRINDEMLQSIPDRMFTYEADVIGDVKENEFPVPRLLHLKVGARVMMLKNDSDSTSSKPEESRRWANGTLGQVSRLSDNHIWVMINGVSHQIDKVTWNKTQYVYDAKTKKLDHRVTASIKQFPVTLSWATTIHKAQGATYQSIGIDLANGMFAAGQTYVALSRCVDMNHIYLTRPITHEDILTSNEVKGFLDGGLSPPTLKRTPSSKISMLV